MKEACSINAKPKTGQSRPGIRGFISTLATRILKGQLTCPVCKEVCTGLKELGKHIKDHCT